MEKEQSVSAAIRNIRGRTLTVHGTSWQATVRIISIDFFKPRIGAFQELNADKFGANTFAFRPCDSAFCLAVGIPVTVHEY